MKTLSLFILLIVFTSHFSQAQDGPDVWTSSSGNMGRIYAMVIDPQNDNIIYAGGLDSGIYKTTNAGLNWFSVNTGLTYKKVQSLAISSSNPQILFAGTDQNGSSNSGIYKTTNGGANWAVTDPCGDGYSGSETWVVAIDSDGSNMLVADTNGRIFRSPVIVPPTPSQIALNINTGNSWKQGTPYMSIDNNWKTTAKVYSALPGSATWESVKSLLIDDLKAEELSYQKTSWRIIVNVTQSHS